eukprot:TRINITY_DN15565_c0_g1_i1.p1 TRINITY_DN15565_c0_g1~~TRINITY_DN15565_c0_g1_i1.p1  ORF type:complete len:379 (+),score=3.58 TRINITY_DN15565_c0_g1_i1:81-1139(+)
MPPLPLSDEPYVLPPPESGIWTRVAEAWRRKWLAERRARHQEWQRACEREQEVLQEKDNIVKELCRRFRVVEVAWRRRLAEAEQLLAAASPGSTGALNTPSPPLPADGPRSPVRPTSPQTAPEPQRVFSLYSGGSSPGAALPGFPLSVPVSPRPAPAARSPSEPCGEVLASEEVAFREREGRLALEQEWCSKIYERPYQPVDVAVWCPRTGARRCGAWRLATIFGRHTDGTWSVQLHHLVDVGRCAVLTSAIDPSPERSPPKPPPYPPGEERELSDSPAGAAAALPRPCVLSAAAAVGPAAPVSDQRAAAAATSCQGWDPLVGSPTPAAWIPRVQLASQPGVLSPPAWTAPG